MILNLLLALTAVQNGVEIQSLLQPGDAAPGRPGETVQQALAHAIDNGQVLYTVSSSPGGFPWYRQTQAMDGVGGAVTTFYDSTTLIPGTGEFFHTFDPPTFTAGSIFVREKDEHDRYQGIYSSNGTAMMVVANDSHIPAAFEPGVTSDGNHLAFIVKPDFQTEDLWLKDLNTGSLQRVVGYLDSVPGVPGAWISSLAERAKPHVRNGWLVVDAWCNTGAPDYKRFNVVLRYDIASGVLSTLADLNTVIPGYAGSFNFYAPITDGQRVLFEGRQQGLGFGGWVGLYMWENGQLSTVVDMDTPLPDGSDNFYSFTGVWTSFAMDGDVIIFPDSRPVALDAVYAKIGDLIVRLVGIGDSVPGGPVYRIHMAEEPYSNGQVAVSLKHAFGAADGTYLIDFPVPELSLRITQPLQRGSQTKLIASGAQSGDLVHFAFSMNGAKFEAGPCLPALGGLCLDIHSPIRILGHANADATGNATFPFAIPMNAPLIKLSFQAASARGLNGQDSVKSIVLQREVLP
ncbi:MAG: hypothetical protein HQ519_02460 [Planctomycetes bacterium]|nr:hypothetical protein [Planctomycetota bacterium]